jgi:hypothetical protein
VTEIKDESGKSWLEGPPKYTPLALHLPPGVYSVAFRNLHYPAPISVRVRVEAGKNSPEVAEFERIDPADYFKRAGL